MGIEKRNEEQKVTRDVEKRRKRIKLILKAGRRAVLC